MALTRGRRSPLTLALLLLPGCVICGTAPASETLDRASELVKWKAISAAAVAADGPPMTELPLDEEWYVVTIADVPVGYMQTATTIMEDGTSRSMEVMDVQVSRGVDTSRMAFETVFEEHPVLGPELADLAEEHGITGGVRVMAYDQRFATNEVQMKVTFPEGEVRGRRAPPAALKCDAHRSRRRPARFRADEARLIQRREGACLDAAASGAGVARPAARAARVHAPVPLGRRRGCGADDAPRAGPEGRRCALARTRAYLRQNWSIYRDR